MLGVWRSLQGHVWTVGPHLYGRRTGKASRGTPFSTTVSDPVLGGVVLRGRLFDRGHSGSLLVVVHGLGGSSQSAYVGRAVAAAEAAGVASALVDLRGADLSGEDVYHAGLFSDVAALVECPELERYRNVYLLGYSLGGHLALGVAIEGLIGRLKSVAAICSPLDLKASAAAFDRLACWPYRRHVLAGLKASYAAVARRRGSHLTVQDLRAIRRIRDWDSHVVVPRFGFGGVDDYYERVSVGKRLAALRVPGLYVAALADPMVPLHTVTASIEGSGPGLEVRRVAAGGHVGFPSSCDLGVAARPGLEPQVVAWLLKHA